MNPATNRFFNLPELINQLMQHLDQGDISRLMRTSQHLSVLCTPAFYHHVNLDFEHLKLKHLFSSKESTQAFARNVNLVRHLDISRLDIVYYINCTIVFRDLPVTQQAAITAPERQPTLSLPLWLAQPDLQSCVVVPIPPMTLLTKLEVDLLQQDRAETCPYYLATYKDPKAILTQLCWIIQSNSHLQDLTINCVYVKDERDIHLLTASISGLRTLKTVAIKVVYWDAPMDSPVSRVRADLFFACPPSVHSLQLMSCQEDLSDRDDFLEEYIQLPPGKLHCWEKSEEEFNLTTTGETTKLQRRQGPLLDLKELSLFLSEDDITDQSLLSILQHCPNLTTLGIPTLPEVYDTQDLALKVVQYCPKLRDLSNAGFGGRGSHARQIIFWALQHLPEQQVTRVQCTGSRSFAVYGLGVAGFIFQRHSRTLRNIIVMGCLNIDSKAIQVIIIECAGLKSLRLSWAKENSGRRLLCIDLDDAVEFPWACTRLEELTLTIAIPDQPFHRLANGATPYYERPSPIAFSTAEEQQLKSLETLYRQIGALTNIRLMDLRAEFYDPEGSWLLTKDYKQNTFPGLLSLGCGKAGRPGFLHLLAGLTQLRWLYGSFSFNTKENKATVGVREVEWMNQHWQALEESLVL